MHCGWRRYYAYYECKKFMKHKNWFVRCATLGPVGYCKAPGTLASVATLPLVWAVGQLQVNFFEHAALLVLLSIIALWIIGRGLYAFSDSDPSEIVLDELIGCLVTFSGVTITGPSLLIGFLLFRFFDIFKPLGIHRVEMLAGEWGILLDDVVAGLFSCALLHMVGLA